MTNKSFLINTAAVLLIAASFYLPENYHDYLYYTGLFALSGSITNQAAIYMIFNKVPLVYGSGVIELNFEKIKQSIANLIIEEFFTKERVKEYLSLEQKGLDISPVIEKMDFNPIFDSLKNGLIESKLGQVINMFGGEKSLELLRVTFVQKTKSSILSIVSSDKFKSYIKESVNMSQYDDKVTKILYNIVKERLDELTPAQVKDLVSKLIRHHLDWLVVWGGIFGGILGFLSVFIANL